MGRTRRAPLAASLRVRRRPAPGALTPLAFSGAEPILAGEYDPRGVGNAARVRGRLERALGPFGRVEVLDLGPLVLGIVAGKPGTHATRGSITCALEGRIDNLEALAGDVRDPAAVLAGRFESMGTASLASLRGAFAIVFWDAAREEGVLVRDHLAQRPLFVYPRAGRLTFATELMPLLRALPTQPAAEMRAMVQLLAPAPGDDPVMPYAGVERVPAGHFMRLDPAGRRVARYWEPRFEPPLDCGQDEIAPALRTALSTAVEQAVGPAERVGVLLSGGLDSSAVAAIAGLHVRGMGRSVKSYSARFPENPVADESEFISSVNAHVGLPGTSVEVFGGSALRSALEYLAAWGLVQLVPNGYYHGPLADRARADGVEVMLTGEGGDEVFGPPAYLVADELSRGHLGRAIGLSGSLARASLQPSRRVQLRFARDYGLAPLLPRGLEAALGRRAAQTLGAGLLHDTVISRRVTRGARPWDTSSGPRWWQAKAYTLTGSPVTSFVAEHLCRVARMRNTVSRHPLLSADLVDFVLRLPPDGSIGDLSRPDLRRATSGILPDDVRLRRHKRHFTAVIGLSLRADLPVVHELLSDPHARVRSLVRPDAIERLMNARPDRWGALTAWTVQILPVLMVECWLRALEDGAFAENMLADERLAQTQIRFVESAARG